LPTPSSGGSSSKGNIPVPPPSSSIAATPPPPPPHKLRSTPAPTSSGSSGSSSVSVSAGIARSAVSPRGTPATPTSQQQRAGEHQHGSPPKENVSVTIRFRPLR
jgi:hypothetical protein